MPETDEASAGTLTGVPDPLPPPPDRSAAAAEPAARGAGRLTKAERAYRAALAADPADAGACRLLNSLIETAAHQGFQ